MSVEVANMPKWDKLMRLAPAGLQWAGTPEVGFRAYLPIGGEIHFPSMTAEEAEGIIAGVDALCEHLRRD